MIKTISVKKIHGQPGSVRGSLSAKGLTRFPGAKFRIPPYLEPNGTYRTGLDEDALYISRIADEKEREMEKTRVRELRRMADLLYGKNMDLSSTSEFYTKMTDRMMGTEQRCPFAELLDGDNNYNISEVKEDLITYAYLRVHPEIAPSKNALLQGKYAHCKYFVNEIEVEDENAYTNKKEINKAIIVLDSLSIDKQRKVARQLGLSLSESASDMAVYNALDNFIKQANKTEGKFNATRFIEVTELRDENLEIMDTVKLALKYNILKRDTKTGKIKRAGQIFADSEDKAIIKLSDPNNQDDLYSIKSEIEIKLNTAK